MKKEIMILILLGIIMTASSCKTKEVPGRVRAPRNCNTCTKWSYAPEQTSETLFFAQQ